MTVTDDDAFTLGGFMEWMLDRDDLTTAQQADLENAQSMYESYVESGTIDESDEDDAVALDNVEYSVDVLATIEQLRNDDEYFNALYDMTSLYTNFTMMVGSAYTANVSIYQVAHVSSYGTFASCEGLHWGSSNPTSGWYTKEKAYITQAMTDLGYSASTLTSSQWSEVKTQAYTYGEIGHYLLLFYGVSAGKDTLMGLGHTTESYLYPATSSYNACYRSAYSSYEAYTPAEFQALIDEYRAYLYADLSDGYTGWGSCEWQIDADGVLTLRPLGNAASGTIPSVTSYTSVPWYSERTSIMKVVVSGDVKAGEAIAFLFYDCSALSEADLSGLDTSNTTNIYQAFSGCSSLESLDLSGFDTSSVSNMRYLFHGCSSLESLDLSGFDTSSVSSAGYMFYGCTGLRTLVLGEGFTLTEQLVLPKDSTYGTGAWLASGGVVYSSVSSMPSGTADTYVALFKKTPLGSVSAAATTCAGESITASVELDESLVASAFVELAYQWYDASSSTALDGQTSATLVIDDELLGGAYYCVVSDEAGYYTTTLTSGSIVAEHSWGVWTETLAATCTADGLQTRTCSACGATENEAIAATGHMWGEWEVTVAATTEAEGEMTRACTVCGAIETQVIEKLASDASASSASATAQNLKVTTKTKTVKARKLKKTKVKVKCITKVSGAKGKLSFAKGKVTVKKGKKYKAASKKLVKKFTVNKSTGKITLKKGLAKGTYKVKVKVTAAAKGSYKKTTKTVSVTIKVK